MQKGIGTANAKPSFRNVQFFEAVHWTTVLACKCTVSRPSLVWSSPVLDLDQPGQCCIVLSRTSPQLLLSSILQADQHYITTTILCVLLRLCNRFERFRQSALSHGCGRTNTFSFRSMAAILRSGKFLRLFSGVARNLAASSGKNDDNGLVTQHGLSFDRNFSQTNFSIQNVLPYLGVSDSGHAEDR